MLTRSPPPRFGPPMLFLSLVAALAPVQAQEPGPERAHPRRLLVRVDPRFQDEPAPALFPGLELRELWNLPQIGWRALEVAEGAREATRVRLASDPAVLEVRHDTWRDAALVPNDVLFTSQWYLERIRAPLAWETELGDPAVVVAVIDT